MERRKIQPDQPKTTADALRREGPKQCKYYLSTGSTLLDLAVSGRCPGGVGSGRVVQIVGDNATGKTVVAKEILGAAQRLGGTAVEEDAEYTPDFGRAHLFGLRVGAWEDESTAAEHSDDPVEKAVQVEPTYCYRNPQSIEQVFDGEIGPLCLLTEGVLPEKSKKGEEVKTREAGFSLASPLAISVDTFTALPSEKEEARDLVDNSFNMERAKSMSAGFRKWLKHVCRTDTTIVAVDHIRNKVGMMFGPTWTTSGGLAMQQYASTRILLATAGVVKNKADVEIGVKIRAKVVKNKIAPPHRGVEFYVLYDYGIDDVRSNLEWLKEQKVEGKLKVQGGWYSWGDDRLGNGLEAAIAAVEERIMEGQLRDEVARVWREVYASPERKEKER